MVVVAPATADLLAKMAHGLADDLASTVLLATDRPVLVAPAMNFVMWDQKATQENLAGLKKRGVHTVGPKAGELAEGETGMGRMSEPLEIVAAIEDVLANGPLKGKRALVTSGPTYEPIDPVRFIGNRSSGKQGHAIAAALAALGADTVLVTGPTNQPDPAGVQVKRIETAQQMLAACMAALPVDIAVCAAAVADWRTADPRNQKLKKNGKLPTLELVENPDILATLSTRGAQRPGLVVGFAAETENVVDNAIAKRKKKGCDWILANDVSAATGTFGGDANTIHLIDAKGAEAWPKLGKDEVARRLAQRIGEHLGKH
jgi:phosphopantothenoylcysteine decarboxylase/phosphopantothenate--cysteine ligase